MSELVDSDACPRPTARRRRPARLRRDVRPVLRGAGLGQALDLSRRRGRTFRSGSLTSLTSTPAPHTASTNCATRQLTVPRVSALAPAGSRAGRVGRRVGARRGGTVRTPDMALFLQSEPEDTRRTPQASVWAVRTSTARMSMMRSAMALHSPYLCRGRRLSSRTPLHRTCSKIHTSTAVVEHVIKLSIVIERVIEHAQMYSL